MATATRKDESTIDDRTIRKYIKQGVISRKKKNAPREKLVHEIELYRKFVESGTYSTIWFQRDIQPIWEEHLLHLRDEIQSYLEIGVCEGASMRWVLENIRPHTALGIDWFAPGRDKRMNAFRQGDRKARENLAPWLADGTLELINNRSQLALKTLDAENGYDLIYIDGGHLAVECLEDVVLAWPFLKIGGRMIIDDLYRIWHRGEPLVRMAVRAFEACYDGRYFYWFRNRQQAGYVKYR